MRLSSTDEMIWEYAELPEEAEMRLVRIPLLSPFETSFGVTRTKEAILIILRKGDVEAFGECVAEQLPVYSSEYNGSAWIVIRKMLLPLLGGENCTPRTFLEKADAVRGHSMAKACIEMALWDFAAKCKGITLQKLIGGSGEEIQCGISIGIQRDLQTLLGAVSRSLDEGYRRIKLKIKKGWDTVVVKGVRAEFGDIPLQVDANADYTLKDMKHIVQLDAFDLTMIEQPMGYDDLLDHAELQRRLKTSLCIDESIKGPESVRLMARLGSGRVMNIKAGRMGGISRTLEANAVAQQSGIGAWIGGMLETGIGRAFNVALNTIPNVKFPGDTSPSSRYFRKDIIVDPFEMDRRGMMKVPRGAGIGVQVDWKELDARTVKKAVVKIGEK